MHAALIKTFGEPTEVLELADLPEPPGPAAGEVLVGVEYAPVNMNDLSLIQGAFPVRPSLPSIVGNEGVGRVLAVGGGVEHLKVGDRVLIPLYAFSWRERLVVPATGLFSLPDAEPQQLAMLGINPPSASLLLDEAPDLKPGNWVVQNAANSGVGRSLIAIAKTRGIKTINLVRRPELIPELQAIGADLVVVDEDGALDEIRAAVGNDRVPLSIDGVAGKSSATIAGALSELGIFVVYALMGGGPVVIDPLDLIVKRIVVKGFFLNHPDIEPKIPAALREAVPLVASGAIQVPIAGTYPLSSLREAILHVQRGGKVLLDLRGAT
jgi:NADPH:quinone reductase-like Zn-dependent oxidoreductase